MTSATAPSLPASTHLGTVHLAVADLDTQADFYTLVIGLSQLSRAPDGVSLGVAGRELLRLSLKAGSRHYPGRTGLYHFCLLTPERRELGLLLRRLIDSGTELQGLVDHHTSEAIYLADPEGNGIELNWDRPKQGWPNMTEMMRLGNGPLDSEGLLELAAQGPAGAGKLPTDATVSHIHLHVADVEAARGFYHGLLGFDITGEFRGQAVFTSAGGYHHHIAFNIWNGRGAAQPPADASGLLWFSVVIPEKGALDEVLGRLEKSGVPVEQHPQGALLRDPSGNGVLLKSSVS